MLRIRRVRVIDIASFLMNFTEVVFPSGKIKWPGCAPVA
jgi:hypothetical protein